MFTGGTQNGPMAAGARSNITHPREGASAKPAGASPLTLDADAGNDLQATGTRLVLRFDAEQVVNNPLPAQG